MKSATMKEQLKPQLQHAVKVLERNGHAVHIKQHYVDNDGNNRYYFTLLKRTNGKKFNVGFAKRTLSVFGATVKTGKGHPVAGVLADKIVQHLPGWTNQYHCQRMTVIL